MALETATKIDELVVTNPANSDPLSEGSDHLRLIKAAVKGSFPNFGDVPSADSGIVTLTADEINALPTDVAANTTLLNTEIDAITPHVVPQGVILMWSGSVATIPVGWALCDGTGGTPDLRDKFIVGAGTGGSYGVGDTGGATSATSTAAGAHDHSGNTGGHALDITEMPKHRHYTFATPNDETYPDVATTYRTRSDSSNSVVVRGTDTSDYEINRSWDNVSDPPLVDGIRGGEPTMGLTSFQKENDGSDPSAYGQTHAHTIAAVVDHTHDITDLRPPYYALAYIMKTTAYTDPTP